MQLDSFFTLNLTSGVAKVNVCETVWSEFMQKHRTYWVHETSNPSSWVMVAIYALTGQEVCALCSACQALNYNYLICRCQHCLMKLLNYIV